MALISHFVELSFAIERIKIENYSQFTLISQSEESLQKKAATIELLTRGFGKTFPCTSYLNENQR